ncbi:MAG: CBS domain-containing protein [Acetobacteraceae bacterium]
MAQTPETKPAHSTSSASTAAASGAESARRADGEQQIEAAIAQVEAAERTAAASAERAVRQGGDAAEQTGRTLGETVRRGGAAGAEVTRVSADVGMETMRRSAGTVAHGQRQILEQAADQFESLGRCMAQAARETASGFRSFMLPQGAATEGLRDLQDTTANLVSDVMRSNLRVTQELLRMTDPGAVFEMQHRFMREYMDALLQGTGAIIRVARHAADHTLRPLEMQIREHRQERGNGEERQPVVADVMTSDVRTATPDDTVQQATRMMREADTGVLPVGEGDRLVGVVTDRDVALRLVAEGKDPARTKVREVMTQDLKYVFEDEDLEHAADNMAEQQVHRLPVVNRSKRLVGVISVGDLARAGRSGRFAGRAERGIARDGGGTVMAGAAE